MLDKPAILFREPHDMETIPKVQDITQNVAIMYDAIVQSIDWGSGFLCTEEIQAIVDIAKLMGWELPVDWEKSLEKSMPADDYQKHFGFPKKVR